MSGPELRWDRFGDLWADYGSVRQGRWPIDRLFARHPEFALIYERSCLVFCHEQFTPKTWDRLIYWLMAQVDGGERNVRRLPTNEQHRLGKLVQDLPKAKVMLMLGEAAPQWSEAHPLCQHALEMGISVKVLKGQMARGLRYVKLTRQSYKFDLRGL